MQSFIALTPPSSPASSSSVLNAHASPPASDLAASKQGPRPPLAAAPIMQWGASALLLAAVASVMHHVLVPRPSSTQPLALPRLLPFRTPPAALPSFCAPSCSVALPSPGHFSCMREKLSHWSQAGTSCMRLALGPALICLHVCVFKICQLVPRNLQARPPAPPAPPAHRRRPTPGCHPR